MKKVLLTATFVLASFGAFAANATVKSNNAIVPAKNSVEIVNISNKTVNVEIQKPGTCTVGVNLGIISFSYSWEC
jgi:hypothetical protein